MSDASEVAVTLAKEIDRLRTENAEQFAMFTKLNVHCASVEKERDTLIESLARQTARLAEETYKLNEARTERDALRELVREANEADYYICDGWSERAEKALNVDL